MLVSQILRSKGSSEVATIPPSASVQEAAEMLAAKRIGAVVVSRDGNRAEGILSERDIVAALGRRGAVCMTGPVSDLMTAEIMTCAPDDTSDAVLERMTDGRFRHLPVVAEGRMVGLISIGDVVKARLAELAMERAALEGMIMGH